VLLPMAASLWVTTFLQFILLGGGVQLRASSSNEAKHFVYDYANQGQDWLMGQCASRSRQSPIDFVGVANLDVAPADFKYTYERLSGLTTIVNNGKTLSVVLKNEGYGGVSFGDVWYELMNLNVHALSEHTFDGKHLPLELHLVHKRYDSDALLIVAIPVDAAQQPSGSGAPLPAPYVVPPPGEANFNPVLQLLLKSAPPGVSQQLEVPSDPIMPPDLNALMEGAEFLGYSGSTTAPPCAEKVSWLVRDTPVMASNTQVKYLHDVIFTATQGYGNYRSVMPVGSAITKYRSVREVAPRMAFDVKSAMPPADKADSQLRAMKWSRDALRVATASLDYVKNLDQRLHSAAEAQAEAFAPSPAPKSAPEENAGGGGGGTSKNLAPAPTDASVAAPPTSKPAALSPEQSAQAISSMVAKAAKDAIQNATAIIVEEARVAAMGAAREASQQMLGLIPGLPNAQVVA